MYCNHLGGVHELDLGRNNLSGQMPNIMALLTDLNALWMNDNGLTGDLPGDMLESLPSLVLVYLEGNNFTQPLPQNLPDNWSVLPRVDEAIPSHGQPFPPP